MSPLPARPPTQQEVEVSLFGPGVGEALAIHTGDGRWVLVDSCRDRDGEVATLRYLDELGLDPSASVDWVIATHAHNDHVSGLASIVRACTSAQLVFSAASTKAEFLSLVSLDEELRGYGAAVRVYSEFFDVMNIVSRDNRRLHYANPGQYIPAGAALPSSGLQARMLVLAPSDDAVLESRRAFAALVESFRTSGQVRQITGGNPNSFSLGLLLEARGVRILLGGDVENGTSARTGWQYVCSEFSPQRVDVHKVPHHGSEGAISDDIWTRWLHKGSINIVTAYRPSGIPRPAGITRMASFGQSLYGTSGSTKVTEPRKVQKVGAELRGVSRSVRSSRGLVGHVRVRLEVGKLPSVALSGPALKLS